MPSHRVDRDIAPESVNALLHRIAARDPDAFTRFYRHLVRHVFARARAELGDTPSAVAVTKAVFVEVWRLAPTAVFHHRDAIGWLAAITTRRITERIAVATQPAPPWTASYDEHTGHELNAVLQPRPDTDPRRPTPPASATPTGHE
jgi:DNA-directed RNA polymerase specialized sigma24 family protein